MTEASWKVRAQGDGSIMRSVKKVTYKTTSGYLRALAERLAAHD
jgi:hypothetical protein